jgi:hypothetical protein
MITGYTARYTKGGWAKHRRRKVQSWSPRGRSRFWAAPPLPGKGSCQVRATRPFKQDMALLPGVHQSGREFTTDARKARSFVRAGNWGGPFSFPKVTDTRV